MASRAAAELLATLRFAASRTMAEVLAAGAYEMYRSLSKRAFVSALQRLVPALRAEDIRPRRRRSAPGGDLGRRARRRFRIGRARTRSTCSTRPRRRDGHRSQSARHSRRSRADVHAAP